MTPELYRLASDLFNEFRELPDADRTAALDSACAGNAELRAQVVRLLEADREAIGGSFLERPALEDAASLISYDSLDLPPPGTVIGNYRLGARIGEGGMGVVFEADDLRLQRRVAVKVLPRDFAAQGKERIQHFQREARAASLLNHPNVVSVFDADFGQGWCYIAMEFVEGKTLRRLIASDARPLDAKSILDLICQAASALSAAHEAGIVHRDIKPENIMVRDDGFVKVLDFGLAKFREAVSTAAKGTDLRTRAGDLAGTIQYLSPEQILGQPAGPRSDLFSLGVVAYELATGVRPFDGLTDGAVFNAILNRTPPAPSAVRPSLGSELDALIMCLLEKDPELRFQTAGDLRSSCRRLTRNSVARGIEADRGIGLQNVGRALAGTSARPRREMRLALLAAGVGLALASVIALFWLTRLPSVPRVTQIIQITRDGLPKQYFVTDGTRLYYAAGRGNSETKMFQVSARGGDPVAMPLLTGMIPLDISGDGSEMLLGQLPKESGTPLKLWTAATLEASPRRLGDLTGEDARWSPKGDEIVYCAAPELRIAHGDGSESRVVAKIRSDSLRYPAWSPDGRSIRFTLDWKNVPALWEVQADGSHLHALFPELGGHPRQEGVWTHDGRYFVFSAQQTTQDLWTIPQSPRFSIRSSSSAMRLTNGPLIADRPQSTSDGRRIFFRGRLDRGELVRYDRKSDQWTPYLQGLAAMQIDYSRDGKWITYASYPDASIWRCAADGSQRIQLTTSRLHAMNPRWSPDGSQIIFYGGPPGKPSRLYLVPAGGGVVRELTHGEAGPAGDEDGNWSPDGASLVFGPQSGDKLPNQPQYLPLAIIDLKSGRVSKLPGSEGLWSPRWSPDGRYVAALGLPEPTLWIYNLATHERRQLTTGGESWPTWSADSQHIYFSNTASYRVRISDGKVERVASLNGLKTADGSFGWVGLAPDGSLISTRDAGNTEIYALDWETP